MSIYVDRDLRRWRPARRRTRLRPLARRLRRTADRIYPEPSHTLQVTTGGETMIFINCRKLDP